MLFRFVVSVSVPGKPSLLQHMNELVHVTSLVTTHHQESIEKISVTLIKHIQDFHFSVINVR